MGLKTPVVDRIPTYPGRVIMTPVPGQTNTYDLTRADSPLEEGTPIDKALMDQKAYTLAANTVVYVSATTGSDVIGDGTSTAPFATIQKALDSLPKWLDGHHATIDIAEGTYEERLNIDGFQGGRLSIGVAGRRVIVRGVSVWSSNLVRLFLSNITYSADYAGSLLYCGAGSNVVILNPLTINCLSNAVSGMGLEQNSRIAAIGATVAVLNCGASAVQVLSGSQAIFGEITGNGNTSVGLKAESGGIISYVVRNLTANTITVTSGGGRIYSGAQTNIPAY